MSYTAASAAISLSAAVEQISHKYGVTISFSPTLTDGVKIDYVPQGLPSADSCLSVLLLDTDFCHKKINATTYCLWRSDKKAALRLLMQKRRAEELEQATRRKIEEYRLQRRKAEILAAPYGSMVTPTPVSPETPQVSVSLPPAAAPIAPRFSLKTNALLWATTSPNLAFEAVIGKCFSVELPVSFNLWSPGGSRLHHISLFPTFKYWLGGCAFDEGYIGAYAGYVNYSIGNIGLLGGNLEKFYYDGNLYSAGLVCGYRFALSNHFALEAEIGMGYVYTKYTQAPASGLTPGKNHEKHKWSLTRLALNACYTF